MSGYGNYLQGSTDSTNNVYNLLISGAPGGYTTSGINIGGDTSTTYGVKITSDSTHNAFMDVRGDASNKIAFRHKDQSSGTVTSMLDLTNDSSLTGSGYGATVNGRVNASSYYVGSVDTRTPTSTGVYMGTDGNVGYFNINKGSGTGGFAFKTYNADGTLLQSNLNLMSSGVVQASYYTASGNADDSESVAVMGIDASGNLVRNYNINKRYRAIEARLTASESSVNGPLSAKVNEIVTRINGLNFFSQTISTLSGVTNSSPAPTSSPTPSPTPVVPGLYSFSTFTFTPNGATGKDGPTSLTYNTSTYSWISQYLTLSGGIQQWTVPKDGNYQIAAAGASGGNGTGRTNGGKGVIVQSTISLLKNAVVYILVGQKGTDDTGCGIGTGGGGTFVVQYNGGATNSSSSYTILLVAGGGGGGGYNSIAENYALGRDGVATTTSNPDVMGSSSASSNGYGGNVNNPGFMGQGGAGGGFLTNGSQSSTPQNSGYGGQSFLNGGAGGNSGFCSGAGGFGGGGGSGSNNWGVGGGGGYSGGSCGGQIGGWVWDTTGGGGGGSYDINGTNNNATSTGLNTGDGYVTITL
jgi:hypothetical protein